MAGGSPASAIAPASAVPIATTAPAASGDGRRGTTAAKNRPFQNMRLPPCSSDSWPMPAGRPSRIGWWYAPYALALAPMSNRSTTMSVAPFFT